MSDSVWVWICFRWKPKREDNFVSSYVGFHVGDCASVRGVWAFLPPETLHTGAALTGSQISLFSSADLFVLSGFPNCSKITVSLFSPISISVNTKSAHWAMLSLLISVYHHLISPTNENIPFFHSGDRCEFDRRQGRCVPGVCRNGGTCQELSGGGFRCECPAGGFESPYCTVTARSFPPKSFAMFRGLRQRFHLTISLTWVDFLPFPSPLFSNHRSSLFPFFVPLWSHSFSL